MSSRAAAFAWGFAEATLFFIVPDVLIGWVALRDGLGRGLAASVAATAGATLGGAAVYRNGREFGEIVTRIPGITPALVEDTAARVRRGRWAAIVAGALGGIPYKLYALEAARQGLPFSGLVLVTPLARIWRFALVAAGASFARSLIGPSLRERPAPWLLVYGTVWTGFYIGYFTRMARLYPRSLGEGSGSTAPQQRRAPLRTATDS